MSSRLISAALVIATLAIAVLRYHPPETDEPVPAMSTLAGMLVRGIPNPIGSEENARHLEFIVEELKSYSYCPEVQETFVCSAMGACGTVRNIIAVREGANRDEIVLVAAHYDSVGAGPGAWDNSVGVTVVMELARQLANEELPRTVMFLFDDGEEAGLLGAEAFARNHPRMNSVKILLNVDGMSGLSTVRLEGEDRYVLADILGPALERPYISSSFDHLESLRGGFDSSQVFLSRGRPSVGIQGYGGGEIYHTPFDDLDSVDAPAVAHKTQTALSAVRALAAADLSRLGGKERGAFFDVFGLFVVSAPRAVWLVLALVAGAAWIARRRSWIWTPMALAGIAAAIFAVEMSYLLILPALVAALSPRTPVLGSLCGALLIAAPARVAYETKSGGARVANVRFEFDSSNNESRFIVTGDNIFSDAEKIAKPYPWSSGGSPAWVSTSTVQLAVPPQFHLIEETVENGARHVRGRLISPRGAPQLSVAIDAQTPLSEILVGGEQVTRVSNNYRLFTVYALDKDGVEFEVRGLSPQGAELVLTDISSGLPRETLGAARHNNMKWVPRDMGDSTAIVARVRL